MKKMKYENKGFTLAELLIVVAIIAVLAAISIPILSTRLESSKEATDIANLRAAYSAAQTAVLTGIYGESGGDLTATTYYYNISTGDLTVNKSDNTKCGQGTKRDGKTTTKLPGKIEYDNGTGVVDKSIAIVITGSKTDGFELGSVKFE